MQWLEWALLLQEKKNNSWLRLLWQTSKKNKKELHWFEKK